MMDTVTPKKRRRHGVRVTPAERAAAEGLFLDTLKKSCNVAAAARVAGIPRQRAYEWRSTSETFSAAWDEALEDGVDALELVARKRAVEGSDTLMIFLLKAHRPDKYRETTRYEHTGANGQPVTIHVEWVNDWRGVSHLVDGALTPDG